jgi:predicted transcriptional regulator
MRSFFNAPDENVLRNKIAMVLFSFEKSIGDKLKEANPSIGPQVAASFFQDLLELACKTFSGTDKEGDYASLKQLIGSYDACEIRNSASHPNRGVTDNHWFRVAAIASHPLIDKLQLNAVSEALAAAIEGQLTIPPDYWFLRESRSLPNSLPEQSEHDATGFVGRKQDIKKLRASIDNRRTPAVAVVGPGGTGKTALALCVLNDLIHDPAVRGWCDGLIYVSAKKEELTADGIRQLDVDASIRHVSNQIKGIAEELGVEPHFGCQSNETNAHRAVIICIDNFETVLAEDEDAMEKLNSLLPESAKLLLTSRVRVDGATTIPLGDLQEGDAIGLAGRYAERVVGTELPTDVKQTIANKLNGSPLAIKLAIDLYARNQTLSEATERARKDVLAFSFTNLIDKLSDTEIKVIEALFVSDSPSRLGEIVNLVNEDRETVLQAISSLSRTSLIIREHTEGGDSYSLNENIRGLVRKNSRHIQVRPELQRRLRERADKLQRHEAIQEGHAVTEHEEYFVDPAMPAHVRDILIGAIPILRKKNKLSAIGSWLEQAENNAGDCSAYASFHYFYGRMLSLVGDGASCIKSLRQALDIQPGHIWARLHLAENLLSSADASVRKQAARELEKVATDVDDWPDREYGRFWSLYYSSLEKNEELEQLRQLATSRCVGGDNRYLNLHVTYAGYVECKCVAYGHINDKHTSRAGFEAAFEWLQRLSDVEHLTTRDIRRVFLIFRELSHFLEVNEECDFEWAHARLTSVADVAELLFARGYLVGEVYDDCVEWIEKFVEFPIGKENPCRSIGWAKHLWTTPECTEDQLQSAVAQGFVVARAPKNPKGPGFFIATCVRTGETILCHQHNVDGGGAELRRVRPNELIVLKASRPPDENPRASWWSRFSSWEQSMLNS